MAHTLEPWSTKYKMVKVFGNIDNNELAARLGGTNTYDRRGNVYWFTTFNEDLNNMFLFDSGQGEDWYLSNERVFTGDCSLKLIPATLPPYVAVIQRYFPKPPDLNIGIETWISLPDNGDFIRVGLQLQHEGLLYSADVEIDINNNKLEYGDCTGYNDIPGGSYNFATDYHFYYPLKFVIDIENKEWVRILFAEKTFDVSGTTISSSAGASEQHLNLTLHAKADSSAYAEFFIGNIILTIQEP
jgi:hypothetical protein